MINKQEWAGAQGGDNLDLGWFFKELFVEKFTLEYQELRGKMNLVQMRHIRFLKAYAHNFDAQMNVTTKMDVFARNCIFLGG